jgi:hypothetical protein
MKEKDDLISDLKCIADIAHAGGLCGLDAFGVILAIRRLTIDYFYVGRTEEKMRSLERKNNVWMAETNFRPERRPGL